MEIKQASRTLSKEEIYFLTKAQDVQKMTLAVGQTLEADYWAIYTDKDSEGNEVELFALRTVEGEGFATNSPTFIAAVADMLDCFDPEEIEKFKIMEGQSKAGRTYITCAYAK